MHCVHGLFAASLVARLVSSARIGAFQTACKAEDVLYAEGVPAGFDNENKDVLSSHRLLESLAPGVDPSAIMTCYNLHRKSDKWRLSWKQKLADKLIAASQETLDSRLRRGLVFPLVKGILNFGGGLSSEMLTWAFEHEDGKNPFCQMPSEARQKRNELLEHFAHLLVSGAAESDKKPVLHPH